MDGEIRPGHPGPPAPHAQTPPPPAAHPAEPAAMSMERIDFLLARAEATLRAAAEGRSPARTAPGPGFSRVTDPAAAADGGAPPRPPPPRRPSPPGVAAGRAAGTRGRDAPDGGQRAVGGRGARGEAGEKGCKRWGLSRFPTPPRKCRPEDENFPKTLLERMPAPSWVSVRKRESPTIIVTLKGTRIAISSGALGRGPNADRT